MKRGIIIVILLIFLVGCDYMNEKEENTKTIDKSNLKLATFAGGCFWCMEAAFEGMEGVVDVISGYTGGSEKTATYELTSTGTTKHREVIQVTYDPKLVGYEVLIDLFWRQIDPTDDGGQFADRGYQYTTAIFYHDHEQKEIAEKSKKEMEKSGKFNKPISTEILPATKFYVAEEYHQDYSKKRTIQYKLYEKGSGRLDYKKRVWNEK
jgi:peptide methionine sulfoxide reductase msrA/msrB